MRAWYRSCCEALPAVAVFALLVLVLAGCGTQSTNEGHPLLSLRQCGQVRVLPSRGVPLAQAGASAAETCFWQAYVHCQPARLTVTSMGVDAGATDTLTLSSQGSHCVLTDAHSTYVLPTSTQHTATYTCAGLAQGSSGGLVATNCGQDGDIAIPSSPSTTPTA